MPSSPIRINDLVRLRYTPSWKGKVIDIDRDEVQVQRGRSFSWFAMDMVELVPEGNEAVMAA